MLSAVRRYGVAQALRASVPRSLHVRSTPQLLKWQPSPTPRLPTVTRSFHNFPSVRSSASASVQQDDAVLSGNEPLREITDLQAHGLVDQNIVETITKKMGITTMTDVQSKTFRESLKGDDILAQAKTGTGKTLAFLVPVIQRLMNSRPLTRELKTRETRVRAIVISPTRELAEQIAVQARVLTSRTPLVVQTAVGGSGKREGLQRIHRQGCDLLIGTPGRLQDILGDPDAGINVDTLSAFVLDEADRLLDDGFAPEILQIQRLLPRVSNVDRQTLLFSATVPHEVMKVVRETLKPDFTFVKTVRDDEVPTHHSVPQRTVIMPGSENALPALVECIKQYQARAQQDSSLRPFKAIVYYNSTAEVAVVYEALRNLRSTEDRQHFLGRTRVFGIHGRLSQSQRTFAADAFRQYDSAVLISSDVTARGMDFPDVTHVIQVGVPRDRATYIHRLGRTARANKTGEGWVFLHQGEVGTFKSKVRDIPMQHDDRSLVSASMDLTVENPTSASPVATDIVHKVASAMADVDPGVKRDAYMGQLNAIGFRSKQEMIDALNNLAVHGYKLDEPPSIRPVLAKTLGFTRLRGVSVASSVPFEDLVGGERRMSRGGFSGRGRGGGFSDRGRSGGFGDRGRGGGFGDRGRGGFGDRGRGPRSQFQRPGRSSFNRTNDRSENMF